MYAKNEEPVVTTGLERYGHNGYNLQVKNVAALETRLKRKTKSFKL